MSTNELSTEVRDPEEEMTPEEEARMTFIEHLTELRDRLVYAGVSIIIGFVLCYAGSDYIYEWIKQPLAPIGTKVEEATPEQGLFLSHLSKDGKQQWSEDLGEYLQGAEPAAQAALDNGRQAIVANRYATEEQPEGILVVVGPNPAEDESGLYIIDTVQIWRGAELSDVEAVAGGYNVLYRRVPDLENPTDLEIIDIVTNGETVGDFEKSVLLPVDGNSGGQWTILSPLEWFFVKLKLAGYFGFALSLPFVLWHVCAFVFPGLKANERRLVRLLLAGCGFFAVMGVALSYSVIFPLVLPYLLEWTPDEVFVSFRLNETIDIILKGLLAFGLAFQMPMVVLVLVWLDLVTPAMLTQYRRTAIVIMAVGAALLTPPDPGSLFMMLVPLWLLYELSIIMARVVAYRRKKRKEEDETEAEA